jgi:hypothetical protein
MPESGFVTAFRRMLATESPLINGDLGADSKFHLNKLAATPMEAKSWIHRFIDDHDFLARRFSTACLWCRHSHSPAALLPLLSLYLELLSDSETRSLRKRQHREG